MYFFLWPCKFVYAISVQKEAIKKKYESQRRECPIEKNVSFHVELGQKYSISN